MHDWPQESVAGNVAPPPRLQLGKYWQQPAEAARGSTASAARRPLQQSRVLSHTKLSSIADAGVTMTGPVKDGCAADSVSDYDEIEQPYAVSSRKSSVH